MLVLYVALNQQFTSKPFNLYWISFQFIVSRDRCDQLQPKWKSAFRGRVMSSDVPLGPGDGENKSHSLKPEWAFFVSTMIWPFK